MKEEKEKKDQKPVPVKPTTESTPIKFWKNEDGQHRASLSGDKCLSDITETIKSVLGVKDSDLALQILHLGISACDPAGMETHSWNIVLQSMHDIQPKDAVEARFAAQAHALFSNGMASLRRAEKAEMMCHAEHYTNRAVKLLRLHNETIEALNRYRRGGEQKVTVTHAVITEKAIVNNYNGVGGGGNAKNEGGSPCQPYAEQKPEPQVISHVDNPPWPMGDAACTEEKALAQGQKRVANG